MLQRCLQCVATLWLYGGLMMPCLAQAPAADQVTLEGQVVGPKGEPVENARIYLGISDLSYVAEYGYGKWQETPAFLGNTDARGMFRVAASGKDALILGAVVIAAAPEGESLGVDWDLVTVFAPVDKQDLEKLADDKTLADQQAKRRILHLVKDDVPVEGRIVDQSGHPVEGARIRVTNIQQLRDNELADYVSVARRDAPGNPYDEARNKYVTKTLFGEGGRRTGLGTLLSIATDRNGRFTLHGIGRNRVGWLLIDHDDIVSESILFRTERGETLGMRDSASTGGAVFAFYSAQLEHVAAKSQVFEGAIVDRDSGQPIPDVILESRVNTFTTHGKDGRFTRNHVSNTFTATDAQGRYRISGLPRGQSVQFVATAHASPHLPAIQSVSMEAQEGSNVQINWELQKGVWVKGRAFDTETQQPLVCQVHYYAFSDNPQVRSLKDFNGTLRYPAFCPYQSDSNGNYRIPALPGRGLVTIRIRVGPKGRYYPTNRGQEEIAGSTGHGMWTTFPTMPNECLVSTFHGIREINPQPGIDQNGQDFPLTAGKQIKVRVFDPAGRRLSGMQYSGAFERGFYMLDSNRLHNSGTECIIFDYDPTFPRRLIVWHEKSELAGTLLLEGEQPETIDFQLEPQGVLIGRIIGDDKQPLIGIDLEVAPLFNPRTPPTIGVLPGPAFRTDEDGRFRIEGLAPGMKYNLVTRLPDGVYKQVVFDAIAVSGKSTDLGDLALRSLKLED